MEFADGISLMIKLLVLTTGQYMAEHIIFVLIYVIRDPFVWSCHNDTDPWNTIKAKVTMDRLVVLSCTVKITINDNTLVTHIASPHFVNDNGFVQRAFDGIGDVNHPSRGYHYNHIDTVF